MMALSVQTRGTAEWTSLFGLVSVAKNLMTIPVRRRSTLCLPSSLAVGPGQCSTLSPTR